MQAVNIVGSTEQKVGKGDVSGELATIKTSPPSPSRVPLVLDDGSPTEDVEAFARDAIEQDIQRHPRRAAARTLFREHRGDDDTVNSTRSLYDSDVAYTDIHGRSYCKGYYMPSDEDEQTRLQMVHEVFYNLLGCRHTTIPLRDPKKILDIGTGTGDWAMAIGDQFPDCEVIGTDIAQIQPNAVPLNVYFEIDDAEEPGGWTWPDNEFDMVHMRYMRGAFRDWGHIYRETFKHLKPGGWIEVLDYDEHNILVRFYESNIEVNRWLSAIEEGSRRSGMPRSTTHLQPDFLASFGFVDTKCEEPEIPMGPWPENMEAQKTGKHFLITTLMGIESLSVRVLTEQMGWPYEDIIKTCEMVRESTWNLARDKENAQGMGITVKVLTGRKPMIDEQAEDKDSSRTMSMCDPNPEPNGIAA